MKNLKFSIGLVAVLLVCQNAFSKVDYSKCMKYLSGGGPGSFWDAGITLGNKGEMKLGSASDYRYFLSTAGQKKNKITQESARYSRPDHLGQLIRAAEAGVSVDKLSEMDEKGKSRTKRDIEHAVTFHKDASGNILEINYKVDIPRSYMERIGKLHPDRAREYKLDRVLGGATVKFDVKNGQCVPVYFSSHYLGMTSSGKSLNETIAHTDTELCRYLYSFFQEHTSMNDRGWEWEKIAQSYRANKTALRILTKDKYASRWDWGTDRFGFARVSFARDPDPRGLKDLTGLLNDIRPLAPNKKDFERSKRRGLEGSPVFVGYTLVDSCYKTGLEGVIQDHSIWNWRDEKNGSPKSNSRGRGVLK